AIDDRDKGGKTVGVEMAHEKTSGSVLIEAYARSIPFLMLAGAAALLSGECAALILLRAVLITARVTGRTALAQLSAFSPRCMAKGLREEEWIHSVRRPRKVAIYTHQLQRRKRCKGHG
ncbi:hypothetical protein A245_46688, partial [Pseudomonas syringae pv. actinidiae ICMP 19096]